ncbi:MAG: glutathione-regulated potassium-efflux system ancillary protein KefC [Limisphaerales bacterium]|jgi:glutathione-regulated potassium-efflux system ancillary protein KefC
MMDFAWIAVGFGEVAWLALAFVMGFGARLLGLPPLVGFLAAGFLLHTQGVTSGAILQTVADLGITLLLFTVGLKLNLGTLARPQVWAVTSIHMVVIVGLLGLGLYGVAALGSLPFLNLDLSQSLLLAFALSFSSTVFVVKVLEDRGEMTSLHGRIAIGILLMQDIAAVVFLAIASDKVPSLWALGLLLLIPLRPLFHFVLKRIGHGELLVLYGFLLALGGAELFEWVGVKGDLGALILGVTIASHPKSEEMAKAMLGFKDLFLLGFFVSIGLSGQPSLDTLVIAALLVMLVSVKSVLFFGLLARFKLRARTAFLTTLELSNYSEFGLIVVAIGAANGWIGQEWLMIIALALSFSFVVAAALSKSSYEIYNRHRPLWQKFQRAALIDDDKLVDLGGATIAVIGMGGVGTGTYDALQVATKDSLRQQADALVIGVDIDPVTAHNQQASGRNVIRGDPSDADFWDRVHASHTLKLVMLALPKQSTNMAVLERLREARFDGQIAATARFTDEEAALKEAGATTVFNMYREAGSGFVAHIENDPVTHLPR